MANKNIQPKVGSVSITTVNFNSWATTPVMAATNKSKKTKVKEIVNEIFVECAKVTDDPFWVEKFNLAAVGKFPANFYFYENTLTYKKGAKNNKVVLTSNPRDAALAFMNFLRTNKSIFSPSDEQTTLDIQFNRQKISSSTNIESLTWDIATKKNKECLISYFIVDMTKMMNLEPEQSEQLREVIKVGIFLNLFDKNNITLNNNRIFSIGGLLYDPLNKVFYIDPNLTRTTSYSCPKKKTTNNIPKDTIPQFGVKWEKYIGSYIQQIDKHYRNESMRDFDTDQED